MAKRPGEKADSLMKKASKAFAAGKTQKAYDLYGDAAAAYSAELEPRPEFQIRWALALYTRALLTLKGQAEGDCSEELKSGLDLVSGGESGPELARFEGLFFYLQGCKARLDDEFDIAFGLIQHAREILAKHGHPLDRFELEKEAAQLAADRGDWEESISRSKQAIITVEDNPRAMIGAKVILAELYERKGDFAEALQALELAESAAFDANFSSLRYEMQDRVKIFKTKHPELDVPPEEPEF